MAIIDCCTRALVAWHLSVRCRAEEAITLVEEAAAAHGIQEGELTLGSDNGSALTARRFKVRLAEQGIRHRRGGYRDPESQAFIESWLGKHKNKRPNPSTPTGRTSVTDSLLRLAEQRTTFVITHDAGLAARADTILHLEADQVIERPVASASANSAARHAIWQRVRDLASELYAR